jgi:hypothetical protein
MGIFEQWDLAYFQALPNFEWPKTGANLILHGIEHKNPSFEKKSVKKHAKKTVWRGTSSVRNPSTSNPRMRNTGRTPRRYLVLTLNSNLQFSKCRKYGTD